jgi:hypothetical protein
LKVLNNVGKKIREALLGEFIHVVLLTVGIGNPSNVKPSPEITGPTPVELGNVSTRELLKQDEILVTSNR